MHVHKCVMLLSILFHQKRLTVLFLPVIICSLYICIMFILHAIVLHLLHVLISTRVAAAAIDAREHLKTDQPEQRKKHDAALDICMP